MLAVFIYELNDSKFARPGIFMYYHENKEKKMLGRKLKVCILRVKVVKLWHWAKEVGSIMEGEVKILFCLKRF